jgi:hypothetical protein
VRQAVAGQMTDPGAAPGTGGAAPGTGHDLVQPGSGQRPARRSFEHHEHPSVSAACGPLNVQIGRYRGEEAARDGHDPLVATLALSARDGHRTVYQALNAPQAQAVRQRLADAGDAAL